jgi:hypothetical protein
VVTMLMAKVTAMNGGFWGLRSGRGTVQVQPAVG